MITRQDRIEALQRLEQKKRSLNTFGMYADNTDERVQRVTSFERFKQYAVPADSVTDFLDSYTKHGRHRGRGEDYAAYRIASFTAELEKYGFCFISHHDSVTGDIAAYYPNMEANRA